MYSLVEIAVLNAIAATAMAAVVMLISRWVRRPALVHALWVLVLLKLVTPPIIEVPVGLRLERLASLTERNDSEQLNSPVVAGRLGNEQVPRIVAEVAESSEILVQPSGPRSSLSTNESSIASRTSPPSTDLVAVSTSPPMLTSFRSWIAIAIPFVLGLWALGTVTWFVIQTWRIVLFSRLASTARLASDEIQQQAARIASSIGIRRAPPVWLLDATISPILWSMGSRARVVFPAELLDRVDGEARATLLTHELAHYHRGDHWIRFIEFVVTGLFWWHPVVWMARREIEVTEEHCCDAWVVAQFPNQPRRYAEALLDTIDFLSEQRPQIVPVATGLGQVPFLRERIRLIMSGVAPKSMSGATRFAVLVIAAVLLPLGPELFDGAIRRADAALETLDLNTSGDIAQMTQSLESNTESTLPLAVEKTLVDIASTQKLIDSLEDDTVAATTAEAATWAIVNSPDGRFQAVAKADGRLVVCDTFHRRSFDLSDYQISSIAFVPHRDLLAAGGTNSTVYLFDCGSGEPVAAFTGHEAAIGSVAVSLDGQYVASGSRDGVVKLWDIDYEREVPCRIPVHTTAINCVRFSPDGRLLAIASGDWLTSDEGAVVLWDVRGGTTKRQFEAPSPVGAIAFGPNQLITAEWNGRTTTWDLSSSTASASAMISKDTVSAASFAADAQSMLFAAADGEQLTATMPVWFQRMDRDRDGQLAWNEFQGPRGTFHKLDVDADEIVTRDEVNSSF